MAENCRDVLDSWEDQVDSGILDERLKQISVSNSTDAARAQPVMMQEDTGRTEYKPQLRILRREPNSNSVGNSPRVATAKKPMKTLEQREAEYAEARMRIFGEAAEQELEAEPNSDDSNSLGAENCVQATSEKPRMNKVEVKSGNSIIRQPKGPDGSKGFNSDR
ncbi:hypothetical protein V1264_007724 [Littorina saxatilis]